MKVLAEVGSGLDSGDLSMLTLDHRVDHEILLDRLDGLRGSVLSWFGCYLEGCIQFVCCSKQLTVHAMAGPTRLNPWAYLTPVVMYMAGLL